MDDICTIRERREVAEIASKFTKFGIAFVAVPVTSREEFNRLSLLAANNLSKLEKEAK